MKRSFKIETKTVCEREVKLLPGWKVVQETDSPAIFAPNIPEMFVGTKWCEWGKQFTSIPRKSIYGKIIWGKVYYRHEMNAWGKVPLHNGTKQWATGKEVFESKLRGDKEKVKSRRYGSKR